MSVENESLQCQVCQGKVDSLDQYVRFIIVPRQIVQERETVKLSCGCSIDFPDWQVNVKTGICQIYSLTGTLYLEFEDEEAIYEDWEDE